MSESGYRILDEPRPGHLSHLIVRPFWPLLSLMLYGGWIAWPWLAFNAYALQGSSLRRELLLIAGALAAVVAIIVAVEVLEQTTGLPEWIYPYVRIGLIVGKITFGYLIYMSQERSVALYEHFAGPAQSGVFVVVAAWLADRFVVGLLASGPAILRLVLL